MSMSRSGSVASLMNRKRSSSSFASVAAHALRVHREVMQARSRAGSTAGSQQSVKGGSPGGSVADGIPELAGADQELALIINHELDLEQELEEVKQREAALRTEFDALKQLHDEREKLLSKVLAEEKAKEQAAVDAKRAEMRMLREVQRLREQLQQLQATSK